FFGVVGEEDRLRLRVHRALGGAEGELLEPVGDFLPQLLQRLEQRMRPQLAGRAGHHQAGAGQFLDALREVAEAMPDPGRHRRPPQMRWMTVHAAAYRPSRLPGQTSSVKTLPGRPNRRARRPGSAPSTPPRPPAETPKVARPFVETAGLLIAQRRRHGSGLAT